MIFVFVVLVGSRERHERIWNAALFIDLMAIQKTRGCNAVKKRTIGNLPAKLLQIDDNIMKTQKNTDDVPYA